MIPFRFGVVPYINLAPFRRALGELLPCEFIERTPSRLADLWKEEKLEACILSVADIFDLRLAPLNGASISAGGPVASVLLLHDAPPFVWSRVALDPASRTSNLLARLLVPLRWKNEPAFVHHQDPVAALQGGLADAAVVIGDRALRLRSSRPTLDLGDLWKETTGLPFAFYGLFHGKVPADGWRPFFFTAPIDDLNRMAMRGELDVAAVSGGFYPYLARRYDILRSGASVGRGYGPLLAARSPRTLASLAGKVVAIPGETTTGVALLRLFVPDVTTRVLPFDEIREAVAGGTVDAGVLIHEELLNYPERSLARILCLGEEWTRRTGLPLPVGLNVIWEDLHPELKGRVAWSVRESILYALSHREEATLWARSFGRGPSSAVAERFIRMFANDDTVGIDGSVEAGLEELFSRLHAVRLAPRVRSLSIVEPERPPARIPAAPDVREPALR